MDKGIHFWTSRPACLVEKLIYFLNSNTAEGHGSIGSLSVTMALRYQLSVAPSREKA